MHVARRKTGCTAEKRSRDIWIVGFVYVAGGVGKSGYDGNHEARFPQLVDQHIVRRKVRHTMRVHKNRQAGRLAGGMGC